MKKWAREGRTKLMSCVARSSDKRNTMGSDVEDENIDDIFVFSDEKYSKEVMLRLDRLRNDGNMCDVVLKVNGHDFPVHRNILSASSDYFFAMFNGNMRESSQQEVRISGVDCESMKAIVNFIYTGEISLTWSNVQPILQAANLMLVQSVKNACVRFLESRMSVRNCIGIQVIAETYACEELLEFAIQYMNRNFLNVAAGDEFLNLSAKEMSVVLSSDEICVENEEKVYEALIFWIGHDQERRRQDFPRLLELIRLPLISPYYLVDVVEREEMMNLSPRCKVLLLEAQHYHMLPERREELDNERTKPRNYDRFQEMLIAIGGNGEVHSTSTAFGYHVTTDLWSDLPKLPKDRGYHGVSSHGGHLYTTGGFANVNSETLDTVQRFDVREKEWQIMSPMLSRRSKHGSCEIDGHIFVVGGFDGSNTLNTIESYDVLTNRWRTRSPMPTRRRCVFAVSHDKKIYVIGGHDGSSILNSVEVYDSVRDSWSSTEVPPMRDRRSFPCAVVWEDEMYVMGGYDGNDTLRSVECFNFTTAAWSNITPMSIPRSNAGAAVFNGKIYLVAGWDGVSLNSVECYDTDFREWSRLPSLPRCTTGVRCCFVSYRSSAELKPRNRALNRAHTCVIC